jgi:hypothetical protein
MLKDLGKPGFETLSHPDKTVLKYLERVLIGEKSPTIYEIGVGIGATTLPMAQMLDGAGEIYMFSRQKDVASLLEELKQKGFHNINGDWGSPYNIYSGYHFELARGFVAGKLPPFHMAYIDGGHVFHLDGSATSILKELCLPGGYMVFDDWNWTLAGSPTLSPDVREQTRREYDPSPMRALTSTRGHVSKHCLRAA